ncbi:MAG TPA: hypothetical protein VK454_07070, partial [Myxococcaceae bacterium]|nr:hypothetical protein [Myxococcaceae bacterium]
MDLAIALLLLGDRRWPLVLLGIRLGVGALVTLGLAALGRSGWILVGLLPLVAVALLVLGEPGRGRRRAALAIELPWAALLALGAYTGVTGEAPLARWAASVRGAIDRDPVAMIRGSQTPYQLRLPEGLWHRVRQLSGSRDLLALRYPTRS